MYMNKSQQNYCQKKGTHKKLGRNSGQSPKAEIGWPIFTISVPCGVGPVWLSVHLNGENRRETVPGGDCLREMASSKRQYRPRERKERLADREWGPPAGAEDGSREAGSTSVQQVGDTADLRKEHAANGGGRWARIVWLEDLTNSCRDQSPRRARRAAPATPPRRRWRKRTRRRSPAAAARRLSWSKLRDEDSRCTTTFPTRPRCAGPGRRWRCPAPRPKCRPHFPAFQAVALPS